MGSRRRRGYRDRGGRGGLRQLSAMGSALARPRRQSTRVVPAGGSGGDRHEQSPGISRSAVCDLARRTRRGADERQAARRRARLHCRACASVADPGEPRPRRRCRAAWPHRRHRQRRMAAPQPRRRRRCRAATPRRSRLAVLHERHHRPAEGRDADAPQSDGDDAGLSVRHRAGRRSRRQDSSGAAVARLRTLRAPLRRHGREECRSGIGRFRS